MLTDIDGSTMDVEGGASLTLPAISSDTNSAFAAVLEASGTNSVLSLPALVSLSQLQSALDIQASQGAQILLPSVTSIDNTNQNVFVDVSADGPGTTIDLSGVTSYDSTASEFSVTNGATVLASKLTSLNDLTVYLDGSGTLATNQWTSLTDCVMNITGGTYSD